MEEVHPRVGGCFRHVDGGYYRVVLLGRYVVDEAPMVAYEHLWPFETAIWFRSLPEWYPRFTRVEETELTAAMLENRSDAQRRITAAKAKRRQGLR